MPTTLPANAGLLSPSDHAALYRTLLQGYAARSGHGAVEKSEQFHADGVFFQFFHLGFASAYLQLWAEIMQVEPGKESMIYRQLAWSNLHLQMHGLPMLSLCPETSKVLALARLPLEGATPVVLEAAVKALARQARMWRVELEKNALVSQPQPIDTSGDLAGGNFHSLLLEYGKLAGIDRPALLLDGHPVIVGDVAFSFGYNATVTPGHVAIFGDFGKVDNSHIASVHAALLRMNTVVYMMHGMCLTLSPNQKDHAVCAFNLALDSLLAKDLLEVLENVARMAEEWRARWPAQIAEFSPAMPARTSALQGRLARLVQR